MYAVSYGHVEIVKYLTSCPGVVLDCTNKVNLTSYCPTIFLFTFTAVVIPERSKCSAPSCQ